MANLVRLRVLRFALAAAFCGLASGTVLAGGEPPQSHGSVTAFIVGLRQTVSESGARVLGAAAQWLSKLEPGTGPIGDLRPGISALAPQATVHAAIPVARLISLGASDPAPAAAKRQTRLGLQALVAGTVISGERNWSLGHGQANLGAEMGDTALDPATYLTGNFNHGPVVGTALAEQSLSGHDIEFGLPLPALPDMHVTAARYWWGDRTFVQEVQGYRVGLSYNLNQHLQFEGGRSEDQVHGAAGFLGLRYTVPLDTKRPPGVMPLH